MVKTLVHRFKVVDGYCQSDFGELAIDRDEADHVGIQQVGLEGHGYGADGAFDLNGATDGERQRLERLDSHHQPHGLPGL